jgi:HD-GYP domain-containing protein (c-di-GMP phosphodiesterase class II)
VADLSRAIVKEMGYNGDMVNGVWMSGLIHDIGMIAIPGEILRNPRKLTDIEYSMIREHPWNGFEIVKDMGFPWPIAETVYQHHERLDGSGYPRGLKGPDTLLDARVIAVADVVEAMSFYRNYRPAFPLETALKEIEEHRGALYDAAVADACIGLFREKSYRWEV